ncbi:DUF2807 domain-containing protein [Massilia sp. PAMC28688]|uniref:head GIN domain-containing protein n=1 Tax=Massilia sp. PAMC28688 TaxID=2861283 RepID=UPI001C62A32D|nr:head GIN domain-containing protein [Massilia sp. PAMC28688]QYF93349.1 DUF2807 domain-containing protein [Massilia sp. PAMC28688]
MRTPLLIALMLTSTMTIAAEQTRNVAPFSAIEVRGPVDMVVQVGKPQSIQLKGEDKFLARLQTTVVNGKLIISFPKNEENIKGDNKILLAMPALTAFHLEGAGSAELNNIQGNSVDLGFQGAGRLVANGKVGQLKLVAQGVGDVNTKALLARQATVRFEGIGAVKVHASERLDANVQGMGSLNYYGNPRVVNKQVEGIGTVKAGN